MVEIRASSREETYNEALKLSLEERKLLYYIRSSNLLIVWAFGRSAGLRFHGFVEMSRDLGRIIRGAKEYKQDSQKGLLSIATEDQVEKKHSGKKG
jgi:hypothetical protein